MPRQPAFRTTQRVRLEPVDPLLGVFADMDDPGFAEDAQMLRDRRAAHQKVARQLAGRSVFFGEQLDDPAPRRVCQCLERFHGYSVTK